jgi:lipopolysaccharide transport system permease protein
VFPRALLPISSVLSYGINASMESLVLLAMIPFFPGALHMSLALVAIPGLIACLIMAMIGASLAAAVLNVIYRDVAYLVQTGLLIFYWLTPVIYKPTQLPLHLQATLAWNPVGGVITGLRNALMYQKFPSALDWLHVALPSLVILFLGVLVFRAFEREMLDHV